MSDKPTVIIGNSKKTQAITYDDQIEIFDGHFSFSINLPPTWPQTANDENLKISLINIDKYLVTHPDHLPYIFNTKKQTYIPARMGMDGKYYEAKD